MRLGQIKQARLDSLYIEQDLASSAVERQTVLMIKLTCSAPTLLSGRPLTTPCVNRLMITLHISPVPT
jgi:hypothetical protein